MASSEMQMIPLEAFPQVNEGIPEQLPVKDAEVEVKFPSRPRRRVVIIAGVIAVLIVVIVAASLIGKYVSDYPSDANNKSLRKSVKEVDPNPTQLECTSTAKTQQLQQTITQITQEVAATKSFACFSPVTKAHTSIKPVTSQSIASDGPRKGTSQDPYKISSIQDLQKLRGIWKNNRGKYFIVTQNINLSSIANFAPLPPFEGILDGNNKKILNLKIDGTYLIDGTHLSSQRNTGLFETIGRTGQVKNLGLKNVLVMGERNVGGLAGYHYGRIDNSSVTGHVLGTKKYSYVGGLVGRSYTGSRITDSYTTAKVSGINYVGGLVGYLFEGTIQRCYATGSVLGIGWAEIIGGLVGDNYGTILSSYATGDVSGQYYIGGLVGLSGSGDHIKINNSYATGNVSGSQIIGGLVGSNRGTITKCYAIGQVSGKRDRVGGLVGANSYTGRIDNSYVTGQVLGTDNYVGGLVGRSYTGSRITDSYATAKVSGKYYVGGLVGDLHQGTIQRCYATGTVSGIGNTTNTARQIGGLVGHNYGTILSSYATGDVSGRAYIGGLVGLSGSGHHVKINNSYATGNVSGSQIIGGLVGDNRDTITKCYAIGQVSGSNRLGGLVGDNDGYIDNSYATGQVLGTDYGVGGLVGTSYTDSRITDSYATAKVSGRSSVGGLVGDLYEGTIQRCYATGTVSGIGSTIGGLVGDHSGAILSSYATGDVSGWSNIGGLVGFSSSGDQIKINNSYATGNVSGSWDIGGLVGENRGTITTCYAIGQLSGKRDRVGGLVGENTGRIENSYGKQQFGTTNTLGAKTDTELKNPSTFSGWDTRLWKLTQNQYPKLKRLLN